VHIFANEVKGQPGVIEKTRIVEAYGTGKCPKLVREMQDPDRSIRIAALKVCKQVFLCMYTMYIYIHIYVWYM
jgi:hypothetical protein